MDRMPTIAFCGYGRAGKDTAGKILWRKTPLKYTGSLSWAGLPHMSEVLGLCPQEAWETRHERREEWKRELNKFRDEDPAKLIKMSLAIGHIVVGIRDIRELKAAQSAGLIDYSVWVDRANMPVDPTVTYSWKDCDTVIFNNRSVTDFELVIDDLIEFLKIPRRPTELVGLSTNG